MTINALKWTIRIHKRTIKIHKFTNIPIEFIKYPLITKHLVAMATKIYNKTNIIHNQTIRFIKTSLTFNCHY